MNDLAAILARDALAEDDWLPASIPLYARTAIDDRRALIALLRECEDEIDSLIRQMDENYEPMVFPEDRAFLTRLAPLVEAVA